MLECPDPIDFVAAFGCDYRYEEVPERHLFLFGPENGDRVEIAISHYVPYVSVISYENGDIINRFYHEGVSQISLRSDDDSIGFEFDEDTKETLRLFIWPVFRMEYSFLK